MDTIFTVSHHLKLAVGSHVLQQNPDESYFILNQIDLDVGRTILHFTATNARPLRRIAFQIEMGMSVEFEPATTAQHTLLNDVMDDSNVLSLHWHAGAVFYIDHGFIFETQLSDLSRVSVPVGTGGCPPST
jgi:hypothetical protein